METVKFKKTTAFYEWLNQESQQFRIIESLEYVVRSFSLKAQLLNEAKNHSYYKL